jgi:hypothetical protein
MANDTSLSRICSAKRALALARDLPDVLAIKDTATALLAYVKTIGETLDVQNAAAEIKLRAERKAGEMLAVMEKNEGSKNKPGGNNMLPPKLNEMGVTKMQSSRWQSVATVSESDFCEIVQACNLAGKELTQSLLIRKAKESSEETMTPDEPLPMNIQQAICFIRESLSSILCELDHEFMPTFIAIMRSYSDDLEPETLSPELSRADLPRQARILVDTLNRRQLLVLAWHIKTRLQTIAEIG